MIRTAVFTALFLTACGGATPPKANAPSPAPAAATPAEAPAPATAPADKAAPQPTTPSASVEDFSQGGDDTLVKILFSNPTAGMCEFRAYTLIWPGGKKRIDAKQFHVPAGGKRERNLRVHKSDGDISSLNKASAHVELETSCGGS